MARPPEYQRTGDVELEFGVPIPGRILPPERWTETLLRRLPAGPIDWQSVFGRTTPMVLDLGCGNGRYLLASALARPDHDHLGIDLLPMAIRYARRRGNQRGITNLRFAVAAAEDLLARHVSPQSVQEIHIYHPQPHHDPQTVENRLLTPGFLALAHAALAPDGLFVLQTDSQAYWTYLMGVLPAFFAFAEQTGPWPDAPRGRTKREMTARWEGLLIRRGVGHPREGMSPAAAAELARSLPLPDFQSERGPHG
jgi:tRNA (guanine-N7-)-methyltransferase